MLHQRAVDDRADLASDHLDQAIKNSTAYDTAIRRKLKEGRAEEELFFELVLEDLTRVS